MQARDFCYWLQGFFELREMGQRKINEPWREPDIDAAQVLMIREHLRLVFKHDAGQPAATVQPAVGQPFVTWPPSHDDLQPRTYC